MRSSLNANSVPAADLLFVDFEIRCGDSIYLCGSDEAADKYFELFPEARSASARSSRTNAKQA